MSKSVLALAFLVLACATHQVQAITVPYTENFTSTHANWRTNSNSTFATYNAVGGPDGSSYTSSTYNFLGNLEGDSLIIHRANFTDNASGGNFFGNWIAADGQKLSAYVRHNAPEPIEYFLRTTSNAGFPAYVISNPMLVAPNTWTMIEFITNAQNPLKLDEGGSFAGIYGNLQRVQFGIFTPASVAEVDFNYTFDLDQVTVDVPEPTSLAMALISLGSVCVLRRQSN
jgi:hypothetical protein